VSNNGHDGGRVWNSFGGRCDAERITAEDKEERADIGNDIYPKSRRAKFGRLKLSNK
jgi:hypothetical protein